MKLLNVIRERKNIGDVYHFTNLNGLVNILLSNKFKANSSTDKYFSTTRDKNFVTDRRYNNKYISGQLFRITIDGERLTSNYKSIPYDDRFQPIQKTVDRSNPMGDESEERWLTKSGEIPNAKRYIKGISISRKYLTGSPENLLSEFARLITINPELFSYITGYNVDSFKYVSSYLDEVNPITLVNNMREYFRTKHNLDLEVI